MSAPEEGLRLVFLDIDGVICCNRVGELEASKLAQLQRICRETGAKVVLSTDWRRQAALKRQVIQALARLDMECVGATPQRATMFQPVRPQEITEWLRCTSHSVSTWVAIDDRDLVHELGGAALHGHFVKTNPNTGLTARLVSKYRPNMPIVSLVIPRVQQNSIRWVLRGERAARQGLLNRGVVPLLANPTNSDMNALLRVVFARAKKDGVVRENDQVIVIQKVGTTSVVKAVSVVF